MTDLIVYNSNQFLAPVVDNSTALQRYQGMKDFIDSVLKEGTDFGSIPGASGKDVLLKPGAEKLAALFGLSSQPILVEQVLDWTGVDHGDEPFFFFNYEHRLFRGDYLAGAAQGSCNSWEVKYRYRWVTEDQVPDHLDKNKLQVRQSTRSEFAFAIDKAETSGAYGKPPEYWEEWKDAIASGEARPIIKKSRNGKDLEAYEMGGKTYRIPNYDTPDLVNTIQKMAQKRALVGAVLVATNASAWFTQDVEDYVDGTFTNVTPAKPAAKPEEPPARKPMNMQEAVDFLNLEQDDPPMPEFVVPQPAATGKTKITPAMANQLIKDKQFDPDKYEVIAGVAPVTAKKPADVVDPPHEALPHARKVQPLVPEGQQNSFVLRDILEATLLPETKYPASEKQIKFTASLCKDFWPDENIRHEIYHDLFGIETLIPETGQTKMVNAFLTWLKPQAIVEGKWGFTYSDEVKGFLTAAYEDYGGQQLTVFAE